MKTVALLHGWAGGPKLGNYFAKKLEERGFKTTRKAREADFIIAHSTGCYFLPKKPRAKLIICINPPYWPGEPIIKRWIRMNKNETRFLIKRFGFGRFFRNKFWEVFYIFAKPSYTLSVLKNQSHLDFLEQLSNRQMILVRNIDDELCSPEIKSIVRDYKNVSYFEIPGYHSDYYINPKQYIDLLFKDL